MKKTLFSLFSCAVMLFAALALTGCLAKNDVRLLYEVEGVKAVPSATAPPYRRRAVRRQARRR